MTAFGPRHGLVRRTCPLLTQSRHAPSRVPMQIAAVMCLASGATMRRRQFICFVGGAVAAWPLRASAKTDLPRVGVLLAGNAGSSGHLADAFTQGLNALGYVEGKNILIERRYAQGELDRLSTLAGELASLNVDVILAGTGSAAFAPEDFTQQFPSDFRFPPIPLGHDLFS